MSVFAGASLSPESNALSRGIVLSPMRVELRAWLEKSAPSLLPLYDGALAILHQPELPGRSHFLSHAVRDIINMLPRILDGERVPPRLQYEPHLEKIAKLWPKDTLLASETERSFVSMPEESEQVMVSKKAYHAVDQLLRAYRAHPKQRERNQILFQALMTTKKVSAEASERVQEAFEQERQFFMRCTHVGEEPRDGPTDMELEQHFLGFERTLHGFVGAFNTATEQLDAIIQETNS